MLRQNTSGNNQPGTQVPRDDNTDDAVFEVDSISHLHPDKTSLNAPIHADLAFGIHNSSTQRPRLAGPTALADYYIVDLFP